MRWKYNTKTIKKLQPLRSYSNTNFQIYIVYKNTTMNSNDGKNNIQLGEFLFSRIYSKDEHNKTGIIVTRVDQKLSTKSHQDRQ